MFYILNEISSNTDWMRLFINVFIFKFNMEVFVQLLIIYCFFGHKHGVYFSNSIVLCGDTSWNSLSMPCSAVPFFLLHF